MFRKLWKKLIERIYTKTKPMTQSQKRGFDYRWGVSLAVAKLEETQKNELRRERMIKKWKEAKKLYEEYPKIVDAIKSGEHIREYIKSVEEIAKMEGRKKYE